MSEFNSEEVDDDADPSVPTDLLELHVILEEAEVTPEEFRQVYGQ